MIIIAILLMFPVFCSVEVATVLLSMSKRILELSCLISLAVWQLNSIGVLADLVRWKLDSGLIEERIKGMMTTQSI